MLAEVVIVRKVGRWCIGGWIGINWINDVMDGYTAQKAGAREIIKVKGHQHWCLAGDYDLEIGHF